MWLPSCIVWFDWESVGSEHRYIAIQINKQRHDVRRKSDGHGKKQNGPVFGWNCDVVSGRPALGVYPCQTTYQIPLDWGSSKDWDVHHSHRSLFQGNLMIGLNYLNWWQHVFFGLVFSLIPVSILNTYMCIRMYVILMNGWLLIYLRSSICKNCIYIYTLFFITSIFQYDMCIYIYIYIFAHQDIQILQREVLQLEVFWTPLTIAIFH